MAVVAQGELWLMEDPGQKERPALIVSRNPVIPMLSDVVVAPVTSRIRDIPTCLPVGPSEGIKHDSVAVFDYIRAVPKSVLTRKLGALGIGGRDQICAALEALAAC